MRIRTIGLMMILALGVLAAPLPADAQPPQNIPRIGYIARARLIGSRSCFPFFCTGCVSWAIRREKTSSSSGAMRRQDSMTESATWRQSWSASRSTSLWSAVG